MTHQPTKLRIDQRKNDRFRWVLTTSALIHIVIVLGVYFVPPSQAVNQEFSPPIKITLVPEESLQADPEAQMLAQSHSLGESEPSAVPFIHGGRAGSLSDETERSRQLVAEQAKAQYRVDQLFSDENQIDVPHLSRDQLIDSINMAYLNNHAKPRERYVSANTRASEIAPYLEKWRLLMERVGTLNYPNAAKHHGIEGELVINVILNSGGNVVGVSILRSSGEKILDDAAERIVDLAAPFEPFSAEMASQFDTLHIIRTWKFSQNSLTDVTD